MIKLNDDNPKIALDHIILAPIHALHIAQKNSVFQAINIAREIRNQKDKLKITTKDEENNQKNSFLDVIPVSFMNIDEATLEYKINIHDIDNNHNTNCTISNNDNWNLSLKLTVKRSEPNTHRHIEES